MKVSYILVFFGAALAFSACAMAPPEIPEREELRPSVVNQHSSDSGVGTLRETLTTQTLSLDGAIETALLNNPALQAEFAAFEAAALKVPQVSSLMDPRVSYTQFVEGVQTRTGEQQFIASVSQTFPWFGKLRLQGEMARAEALQALENYRVRMLDVREKVQQAWYRLAYEQAALALAEEDKGAIERTLEAAAALYGSGQRGRGELLQSQTELARIENELIGYPASITAHREELAKLLFVSGPIDVPVLDDGLSGLPAIPSSELLIANAIAVRPEIEQLRIGEERSQLAHELAKKEYYPDLTLGVNYVGIGDRPDDMSPSDEGDDAWGVSLGFNIPIPNARRRAAKEQALLQREETKWRRIAKESEITKDVESILPRLTSLNKQLEILETNLMPLAEEAYAANEAAYSSGQGTFLDLLDAQRTLINVRRDLLRVQRDYLLAISELERVAGGPLAAEVLQ